MIRISRLAVVSVLALFLGLGLAVVSPAAPASAADFEYGCNPSATSWNVKSQWPSGTVLEARACLREDDNGDVRVYEYWRSRRGGTPILSDWNLYPETDAAVYSSTTGFSYGVKPNGHFNDVFDTSIVHLANYPACSQVAGPDNYYGNLFDLQVNPNGTTDGVSGWKNQASAIQNNSALDCGRQLP